MGVRPVSNDPSDDGEHLSLRPGRQAWPASVDLSEARCEYGHEVDRLLELTNGLIVGYCNRCSARFEVPWAQGGTAVLLALSMAAEASTLEHPAPDVLVDLEQVFRLLVEDRDRIAVAMQALEDAAIIVRGRSQP